MFFEGGHHKEPCLAEMVILGHQKTPVHGVQTSQGPIFWKQSKGVRVNANVAVVALLASNH